MPTLAPLPSTVPPDEPPLLVEEALPSAEDVFEVELLLEEEHALIAMVAAAPTTMRPSARLRMGIAAFPMYVRRVAARRADEMLSAGTYP